jgi:hypothetical protein
VERPLRQQWRQACSNRGVTRQHGRAAAHGRPAEARGLAIGCAIGAVAAADRQGGGRRAFQAPLSGWGGVARRCAAAEALSSGSRPQWQQHPARRAEATAVGRGSGSLGGHERPRPLRRSGTASMDAADGWPVTTPCPLPSTGPGEHHRRVGHVRKGRRQALQRPAVEVLHPGASPGLLRDTVFGLHIHGRGFRTYVRVCSHKCSNLFGGVRAWPELGLDVYIWIYVVIFESSVGGGGGCFCACCLLMVLSLRGGGMLWFH